MKLELLGWWVGYVLVLIAAVLSVVGVILVFVNFPHKMIAAISFSVAAATLSVLSDIVRSPIAYWSSLRFPPQSTSEPSAGVVLLFVALFALALNLQSGM